MQKEATVLSRSMVFLLFVTPTRWVVEGTHSWFNRFRKLLVRYEKLVESYEALVCLAAAIICWRKVGIIYG
jgi:transposase